MGLRGALLALFLLAFSFAYTDPPISEVMAHNFEQDFLNDLKDQVPEGLGLNPICIEADCHNATYFEASLIGMFPSVEGRVPADAGIYQILWTWGENYTDYIIYDGMEYRLAEDNITYSFTAKVDNVEVWHEEDLPSITYFNLTRNQTQMEKYNATDRIEVRLEYLVRYHYAAIIGGGEVIVDEYGHTELYYYVENGNVIFFLARPVLGEQWYRNNHFDNLVFSKKRFYKSEVYLDGVKVGEARILNFSIYEGAGGAWFINSSRENNYTNATLDEFEMVYTPIPMIPNNESFRYLYEENFTYAGIGRHNLTLVLTDDFRRNHTYSREISSRAAGEQEAAEEGAYYALGGTEYARPTYEKPDEALTQVIIPTGALAIIFIVVLASTWWGMTGAKRH